MSQSIILAPERCTRTRCLALRNGRHTSLDEWLKTRALASEGMSASTYVVCARETPQRVVGYYAISTAMEQRIALPNARLRRAMPDQVPLLSSAGWPSIENTRARDWGDLLSDGVRRCLEVSEIAGVRAIIAHAIDEDAVRFYQHHGFIRSPSANESCSCRSRR